jgi:hypothetical protein
MNCSLFTFFSFIIYLKLFFSAFALSVDIFKTQLCSATRTTCRNDEIGTAPFAILDKKIYFFLSFFRQAMAISPLPPFPCVNN